MFIDRIELINFMSHKHTILRPSRGINVLVGRKGSGKTGVLEAIRLTLGGLGRERHKRLSHFIRDGEKEAIIRLYLNNKVHLPNKGIIKLIETLPMDSKVILERTIKTDGTSFFKLNGKTINKTELLRILSRINISPENNLFFLPQERVNEWVSLPARERLDLFLSAIGLYNLKERISKAQDSLGELEKERKKYRKALDEWLEKLRQEEKKFKPREVTKDRLIYYYVLKIAYLYKQKEVLENQKREIINRKEVLESALKEHKEFIERFDKKIEEINTELEAIRSKLDQLIGKDKPSYEYQLKQFEDQVRDYQAKLLELDERYNKEYSQLREIEDKWGTADEDELKQLIETKRSRIEDIDQEILSNEYVIEITSREEQISEIKREKDRLKREIERNSEYLKEVFRLIDPLGVIEELYNEISYTRLSEQVLGPVFLEIRINLPGRLLEEYIYAIENAIGHRILSSFIAITRDGLRKFLKIARKKKHSNRVSVYSLINPESEFSEDSYDLSIEIVKKAEEKRNRLKRLLEEKHPDIKPLILVWVCDVIEAKPEVKAIIESFNWDVPIVLDIDSAFRVLRRLGLKKAVTLDGEVVEYRKDPITGHAIFRTNPNPSERRASVLYKLAGFDISKYRDYEERLYDEIRLLDLEIKRLQEEINEMRRNLPERIRELNMEKNELEKQILEISKDIDRVRFIKSRLSEIPKEREKLSEAIDILRERIDELSETVIAIEKEIEVLRNKEKELTAQKEKLIEEYSRRFGELKAIERELELIPARQKHIDKNLEAIMESFQEIKEELNGLIILLERLGELPAELDIEKFMEENIISRAESIVKTYSLEELERELMTEKDEYERYKKIIIDAKKHFENIKILKSRVEELREELDRIDEEMAQIRRFYEAELRSLFSELRRRLNRINTIYKEILSYLGYRGWLSVKTTDDQNFELEVTIDINRPEPIELDKGGFSSGEKTIAIMSLILATLIAFPAPIYVFDEFDVFLDDKSLIEVMVLIKNKLKGFQGFITTTHREEIIEYADKIFFLKLDEKIRATTIIELEPKVLEGV